MGEGHQGQKQTRNGLEHQAEGTGSAVRKCLLATQEGWSGGLGSGVGGVDRGQAPTPGSMTLSLLPL